MAETLAVQQVSDADFEATINGGKPVFVDFWAPWCGPCRVIGPIVEELAPSYQDRAVITKMNVDDNPQVAQRLNQEGAGNAWGPYPMPRRQSAALRSAACP